MGILDIKSEGGLQKTPSASGEKEINFQVYKFFGLQFFKLLQVSYQL